MESLRETYEKELVPALMEKFGYKNRMQVGYWIKCTDTGRGDQ